MKKIGARFGSLAIVALFLALWNVLVFVIMGDNIKEAKTVFWLAYAFITLAFVGTGIATAFMKVSKEKIFSVYMPLIIATGAYMILTFLIDTIFMIADWKGTNATLIAILNIIIIVVYVVFLIISVMGMNYIANDEKEVGKNVRKLRMVLVNVKSIQEKLTDADMIMLVRELSDEVEYSNPMTIPEVEAIEGTIINNVRELENLINENEESDIKEEFMKLTKRVINDVKYRNNMIKACK